VAEGTVVIKHFCDICGNETAEDHSTLDATSVRLRNHLGRSVGVVVTATVAGATGEEHPEMCLSCVFGALDQLDPRPRAG
jgi:hypothetical protein